MITLYDFELSGNCYKVRLFLSILGLRVDLKNIDYYPGLAHRGTWFRRINPLGQIPVLVDDDVTLRSSSAILIFLARKYDAAGTWYPIGDAIQLAKTSMWLSIADDLTATASAARLHDAFSFPCDIDACRRAAHRLFETIDEHLWFGEREGKAWLCGETGPTIADIACFPYIMLSEEADISRRTYPALRRWTDRVKGIEGFIEMPGIFPLRDLAVPATDEIELEADG